MNQKSYKKVFISSRKHTTLANQAIQMLITKQWHKVQWQNTNNSYLYEERNNLASEILVDQ